MIAIIVTIIAVGLFVWAVAHAVSEGKRWGWGGAIGILIMQTFFIGAFWFIVLCASLTMEVETGREYKVEERPLVALSTGDTVSGSFFLGIGSVDGEATIRWTERTESGSVVLKEIPADRAEVFEDGSENPTVERWGSCATWVSFPGLEEGDVCSPNHTIFRVPAGSVLSNYEFAP